MKRFPALACRLSLGIPLLFAPACASEMPAAEIRVTPVRMIEEDRDARTLGGLHWRGGFAMTMDDPRFGGLSALLVSADGDSLTAVTDKGYWFHAELTYRDGDLAGIRRPVLAPILDPSGNPRVGKGSDAESLARTGPSSLVVAFERDHRLSRYDGAPSPFRARGRPAAVPGRFAKLPANGGIEALTTLCDGRLLAIAERSRTARGSVEAWIRDGAGWRALTYPVADGLRPTGATTLPDCDVLVTERSFSIVAGLEIRIVRLAGDRIGRSPELSPREVARMRPPVTSDNFEGVAARRSDTGETLVYLLSDDNFSPLQRTLLVMYRLDDRPR